MSGLVKEMPSEVASGLTVYGHRRKGDCSDISEIIPLGTLDRQQAVQAISSIMPKGRTPIADSIQLVATRLKGQENETTIVLVSDGIETCGGDPCAVTKSLKESGIKFIIHTVGFDVGQKASEQLECVASAGGGSYFSASNAKDLLETLSTVQESVVAKKVVTPPEPPPEPVEIKQQVTGSSTSIRLKINRPGRISFTHPSWLKTPYYWEIVDPETGESKGRFNSLNTTMVPVGEYQIIWKQSEHKTTPVILSEVVTVKSGEESIVPLMTSMQLNLPSWIKKPYYWKLVDSATGEDVFRSKALDPCLVPAGDYNLIWRQSEHSSQDVLVARLKLVPDTLNTIEVSTAFNPVAADWMQKKIDYWGLRELSEKGDGKLVSRFDDKFSPQLAAPGKYLLVYRLSEHGSTESLLGEVEITGGKMNEFSVNTGVSVILPQGVKFPYFIEYVRLDGNGKEGQKIQLRGGYLDSSRGFVPIALMPGTYKINYREKQHNSSTITIVESFDLPAGNLVEIEL
jgi:hypothetical protein